MIPVAAGAYKGLTIRIGADTTKLSSALRSADSAIYRTQQQLNKLAKAAKVDPGNEIVKSAQLGALSNQATNAARELAILKKGMDDLGKTKVLNKNGLDSGKTVADLANETENATLAAEDAKTAYNAVDAELEEACRHIKELTGVDLAKATRAGEFETGVREAVDKAKELGAAMIESAKAGNFEGGMDAANAKAKQLKETVIGNIQQVRQLKGSWQEARYNLDAYTDVANLETMNGKVIQQDAHLRKIAMDLANVRKSFNLTSTSSVDRSFGELNGKMSLVSAATETATQRFRSLDAAAKIDPTNIDLAQERAQALTEAVSLTEREMSLLQEKIAAYESRDGFKEKAASIKDVSLNLQEARQRYSDAEDKVAELTVKQQALKGAAGDAATGVKEVAEGAVALENVTESAEELEQQLAEAEKESKAASEALDFAKALSEMDSMKAQAAGVASTLESLRNSFGGLRVQSDFVSSLKPVDDTLKLITDGADQARSRFETLSKAAEIRPYSLKAAVEQVRALREATSGAQQKAALLKQKLEAYKSSGIDNLAKQTNNAAIEFERAQKNVNTLNTKLAETVRKEGETSVKAQELRTALSEALEQAKVAAAVNEFKNLEAELGKVESEAKSMKDAMKADFGEVGAAAVEAATAIGNMIERAGRAVITSSDEIDQAYRNLRKTFDAEESDYEMLYDAAMKYSQGHVTSANTMLDMEAIAAQLGVGIEGGAEAIQKFAEVAANLDVATDIDSESIALQMGQISNVMSDLSTDNIDKFGDALVRLGNNMPTQESNIMQITQRLSAIGDVAGFTTPQLMGWAAAIASTGQRSEAAASGVATTITKITQAVDVGGDDLEKFAKVAGKSAEQFAHDWKTAPSDALQNFMSKLGESEQLFADLTDMDINGIRQTQTLAALAQTMDKVGDSIEMADHAFHGIDDGFGKAGDAAREAERKAEGFSGSLAKMKNSAQVLAGTLGPAMVPAIDWVAEKIQWLTETIDGFSDETKEKLVTAAAAFAVFSTAYPIVRALGQSLTNFGGSVLGFVIKQLAKLATVGTSFKLGGGFVQLTESGGKLAALGTTLSKVAKFAFSAKGAIAVLGIAIAGSLIKHAIDAKVHGDRLNKTLDGIRDTTRNLGTSLFSGELAEYTGAWKDLKKELDGFHDSMDKHADAIGTTRDEAAKSIGALDKYKQIIMDAAGQGDNYSGSIAKLQWAVDGLNSILGTTYDYKDVLKGFYEDESGAVHNLTTEIYELIEAKKAEIRLSAMEDIYKEAVEAQVEAVNAYEKAKKARRDYTKEFVEKNQGRQTRDSWTGELRTMSDKELVNLAHSQDDWRELDQAVQDTKLSVREYNDELEIADKQLSGMIEGKYWEESNLGDREGIMLTTQSVMDAISAYTDWGDSAEGVGQKIKDLAYGIQEAHVGVNEFSELVQQNPGLFEGMIEKSKGNMDTLVDMVKQWNTQHLDDKYAAFHWDGDELVNANGDRLAWNDEASNWMPVKLDADASGVQEGVDEAKAMAEGEQATINVDADTGQAQEDIDAIEGEGVNVPVTTNANEVAGEIQSAIPENTEAKVNVTADMTGVQALSQALTGMPMSIDVGFNVTTNGLEVAYQNISNLNSVAAGMTGANATYSALGNAATSTTPADNVNSLNSAASSMVSKEISLTAVGNAADGGAASNVWNLVSAISNMHDKSITLTTTNVTTDVKKAAGTYINPNKIPKHAAGIFTRPTLTNIGWVGEDGAELYSGNSLVPLTNRKYSMPYIDDISDAVAKKLGGLGTVNNYYVNDAIVNGDAEIQAAFLSLFDTLTRKGAMNVG